MSIKGPIPVSPNLPMPTARSRSMTPAGIAASTTQAQTPARVVVQQSNTTSRLPPSAAVTSLQLPLAGQRAQQLYTQIEFSQDAEMINRIDDFA